MKAVPSQRVCSIVLTSLAALSATGCATVARPLAADQPDEWASRIQSLPVAVHGVIPRRTEAQTVAAVDHGVADRPDTKFEHTGLGLDSVPRVVVYIGGGTVPTRDQYCSTDSEASRSPSASSNGLVVRAELCDGPRPVAYARTTLAQSTASDASVADAIQRLESDLVGSLPTPDPQPPEFGN
jgi:hypothetical protein